MDINDFKDILKGFWTQILSSTYKDPLMVYDFDVMLGLVGRTVGLPESQVNDLKAIIDQAKKTGKVNEKKVKSLYKAIVETEGPTQPLNLILDRSIPVERRVSKLLELVLFPSYKGLYRNMLDSGTGTNYELNTKFSRLDIQDVTRRLPDGPTGFVPSYTNLAAAASLINDGVIAFQPYRKVVNTYDDMEVINKSQSDMFIEAAEAIAKANPDMEIINPSGEIDMFNMTMDKYNALSAILDVVLADTALIEKYGWRDLLDPEVAKQIDAETNGEVRKAFEEAKQKPKMDPKLQAVLQSLHEWKNTQADSWFGNDIKIINSGQLGVEDDALRIFSNTQVGNKKGLTGGFSPSGFINSYKGKANPARKDLYGLQEIYHAPDGKPGEVVDSAEVLKYLERNASPEFKNHIRDLERIGFEDPMNKLAETWIGTQTFEGDTTRFWSEVSGNAAELSFAKQMNVKQADINVITLRATNLDHTALKTAMYSVYGEWKLPNSVSIYRADYDGYQEISIGKDYAVNKTNIDRVADELRRLQPELKRPMSYWNKAAENKLRQQAQQVSDKTLSINNYYTKGEEIEKSVFSQNHTLIVDIDTLRHELIAEALQAFSDALIGQNKVVVRDGDQLKIVDKSSGASKLFPMDTSTQIHLTGQTGPLSPYQRDMLDRLINALISPDKYLSKLAEPQVRKLNVGEGKPNHTAKPIALNTYRITSGEKIENIIKEGAADFTNPNLVSEVELLNRGELNGFIIREADLLQRLNARNVKDAINTLNKQPVMRVVNFDTGEELFVDIQGWEKLEPYKLKKPEFLDELKNIITDQTQLSLKRTLNNKTGKWEVGGPRTFDFDQYVEYIAEQGTKRFDKRFKAEIPAKPFWVLKVRTEPKSPLVERAKLIRQAIKDIDAAQTLYDKYWSYGQDPKAITRVGKRNVPGKVYNLFLIDRRYKGIITDLYNEITSYDLGPRDFDTTRLMHNLASDVYKAESLQEIVNALLTDRAQLSNAYKAVNEEQLELAKKNNLLGKLNQFYKLMGRPNAVLQAIALNVSKELNSGDFDQDAFVEKVSKALQEIKTVEDITELPQSFKDAMDGTNGSHSQYLSAKVLENIHALLEEEFQLYKKYPELFKTYDNIKAIDSVDTTGRVEGLLDSLPPTVGTDGMMLEIPENIMSLYKEGKFNEFASKLFEGYKGVTGNRIDEFERNFQQLMANSDEYTKEFDSYDKRRSMYDEARKLIRALEKANSSFEVGRGLPAETIMEDVNRIISNPRIQEKFIREFQLMYPDKSSKKIIEGLVKSLKGPYTESYTIKQDVINALNEFKKWESFYLATEYLRIDNIFGLETNSKSLAGNDVYGPRPNPIYGLQGNNDFLPYLLTEGLDNFYYTAPTALHALLLNDLNINPAIQDNFISKLLAEYADELFTAVNMESNMQTLAPLLAQQTLLSPEGFKILIDELYKLNELKPLGDVDFNDDAQVKKFINKVSQDKDILASLTKDQFDSLATVVRDIYGETFANYISSQDDLSWIELTLNSNLTRLALRPENINKLLDAELLLNKDGLPTWEGFKKKLLGSAANKVLTGDGMFMDIPKETVDYLKKATKDKVENLARTYQMMLDPNSNLKITVKNNIPDKWDIKVNQGKQINPFTIAPAFGSDAFYHIQIGRKDTSISWKNTVGDLESAVISHIINVEQPNNYVNTLKTLGNEYSSVLKNGYANSYLYSNTLSETVEGDVLSNMLRKEANSMRAYFKKLERDAIGKAIREDRSKIKSVQESFKYLNDMLEQVIIQSEQLHNLRLRQDDIKQGTRSFYGLDDKGSFPLAKVKFDNVLGTVDDLMFFHTYVLPQELRNKALNVKDIADIQKMLLDENVNFEVAQYIEAVQDLTEPKLGRKSLNNGLELANQINEKLFYDPKGGLLSPDESLSKDFKIQNVQQQLYFRKLLHDWSRGIDISKYPPQLDMPNPADVSEMLSNTYNKYEGPYLKDRWELGLLQDMPFKNAADWVESVKEKYGIMKDRKALPQLGPVDSTNFKDFGAMMNLQWVRDFNLEQFAKADEIPGSAYSDYLELQAGAYNIINKGLQDPSRALFNYTNGALNYDLGIPQLPAGDVPNKLVVRGPVGWTIITPPVYGDPIKLGDGLNKSLMPRGPVTPEPGMFYGEGDPFNNAYTAPGAKPISNSNRMQGMKNVIQFLRVAGYQPARYKWNFDQRIGKGIAPYEAPTASNKLPGNSNVGFVKRYFTNLRTLTELPYFYNRTTGRGAGRAYLFLLGSNNQGFKATPRLVPTQPGVELNAAEFENYYRQNKKAFLQEKNLTPMRAYNKALHYGFLADMGLAMINYNKNVGDMTYEDFLESSYTENGAKQLHYLFKPVAFIFEQPYKTKQRIIDQREKATMQYNSGELGLTDYQNKLQRLEWAEAINAPVEASVGIMGNAFLGLREAIGSIGRGFQLARQHNELTAEKFQGKDMDEWSANIDKSLEDLARTKHLTYNYGDDYYNRGRRFINNMMVNAADRKNKVEETVEPIEEPNDFWSNYGTIGLAAGSAGK